MGSKLVVDYIKHIRNLDSCLTQKVNECAENQACIDRWGIEGLTKKQTQLFLKLLLNWTIDLVFLIEGNFATQTILQVMKFVFVLNQTH